MRRRLRKKTRRGEFAELGFQVYARHADMQATCPCCDDARLAQLIAWLRARELICGGGSNSCTTRLYVTSSRRRGVAEQDLTDVSAWLSARLEVAAHAVGPPTDAWHGSEAERNLIDQVLQALARPGGKVLTRADVTCVNLAENELRSLMYVARWVSVEVDETQRAELETFESLRRRGLISRQLRSYRLTATGREVAWAGAARFSRSQQEPT